MGISGGVAGPKQAHCGKPALHRQLGRLNGKKKLETFCTKVIPGSPLSRLQSRTQGTRAQPSVSLSGEAPGSFRHALGTLQLLPAGPDTWQLCAHCSRDRLASSPLLCHC